MLRAVILFCACLGAVAACGGATTSTPATPPPSATPAPTPTPDDQRVVAVETGFGAYLETTFAGALVHNAAGSHAARMLTVHLDVTAASRHIGSADVRIDALPPNATIPVGGRVQGPAAPGESVTATITVGSWDAGGGPPELAIPGAATFACSRCNGAGGSGDVTVPLATASSTPPGLPLALTALCTDSAGHVVGGGAQLFVPPDGNGSTVTADIPAVVSAAPATCMVGVARGGL